MKYKARDNEILDERGYQMCVILKTNIGKNKVKEWTKILVNELNKQETK